MSTTLLPAQHYRVTEMTHHVRPSDLDMFGHVNHAKPIDYFELGRFDWLTQNRFPLDERWTPVVARIEVNYRRELFLTPIRVQTVLAELKQYTAEFQQSVFTPDVEGPAVTGSVRVSFISKATGRPMRLRDVEALACFQEARDTATA